MLSHSTIQFVSVGSYTNCIIFLPANRRSTLARALQASLRDVKEKNIGLAKEAKVGGTQIYRVNSRLKSGDVTRIFTTANSSLKTITFQIFFKGTKGSFCDCSFTLSEEDASELLGLLSLDRTFPLQFAFGSRI